MKSDDKIAIAQESLGITAIRCDAAALVTSFFAASSPWCAALEMTSICLYSLFALSTTLLKKDDIKPSRALKAGSILTLVGTFDLIFPKDWFYSTLLASSAPSLGILFGVMLTTSAAIMTIDALLKDNNKDGLVKMCSKGGHAFFKYLKGTEHREDPLINNDNL